MSKEEKEGLVFGEGKGSNVQGEKRMSIFSFSSLVYGAAWWYVMKDIY
jgi:hypothetical protein